MENLADYSNYVIAAYAVASLAIIGLAAIVLTKFFHIKKIISREK